MLMAITRVLFCGYAENAASMKKRRRDNAMKSKKEVRVFLCTQHKILE